MTGIADTMAVRAGNIPEVFAATVMAFPLHGLGMILQGRTADHAVLVFSFSDIFRSSCLVRPATAGTFV
jgi:hypothetical protein